MAILFAFDEHKNKVAFNGDIPVTVPMQLPDGSILFYDRGTPYGEYKINDSGYPERIDGAVDDGTAESSNWRYLICDKSDLYYAGTREWGPRDTSEGLTDTAVGYGLPNTNAMIAKYTDNTDYWWDRIKIKRDSTGLDWFMPSKDELDVIYDNRTVITGQGGDAFGTLYWSSSEYDSTRAWYRNLSLDIQYYQFKNITYPCRLLRRI